jgi:hypothetical protein
MTLASLWNYFGPQIASRGGFLRGRFFDRFVNVFWYPNGNFGEGRQTRENKLCDQMASRAKALILNLVPFAWYLLPGTYYLLRGTYCLVPITWYLLPGTDYLVPST